MAKRKRDFDKRRLGYVLQSLDKAMEHALTLRVQFDRVVGIDPADPDYLEKMQDACETSTHAQYALLLLLGMTQALMAQETFKRFATLAWGSIPDNVERWTNAGADYRKQHGA